MSADRKEKDALRVIGPAANSARSPRGTGTSTGVAESGLAPRETRTSEVARWGTARHAPAPRVELSQEDFAPQLDHEPWAPTRPSEAPAPPPGGGPARMSRDAPGYYSLSPEHADEVHIPKAPRVPSLDLHAIPGTDELNPDSERDTVVTPMDVFDKEHIARCRSDALGAVLRPSPPPTRPSWLPRNEGEFAEDEAPPYRRSAGPFAGHVPDSPKALRGGSDEGRSAAAHPTQRQEVRQTPSVPPRLYFSPHVRQQANEWSRTGSLSLPGCSSPRHARAVQRALLLALLTEPGWHKLPQGLRQRAGWLFCLNWDQSSAQGHPYREVDDLATVLSMPTSEESRELLRCAISAALPPAAVRISRPPPRRSSRPPRGGAPDRP